MKKITSIKTRITIWYTTLLFVLIVVVLSMVGGLSYQLSIDSLEKDVVLQVTRVTETLSKRPHGNLDLSSNQEELKNVSVYETNGKYLAGEYHYDMAKLPFQEGLPRRETVDGKDYIVYDTRTPGPPGRPGGFWIRGVESVNSTMLLGKSAIIIMLILIPLILLFAALGGYYITKHAFHPVNNIIQTAKDISAQKDMKKRIPLQPDSKQDELYNLSVTLNEMLDKIEHLLRQEKQFTSDASHELRTPISVILAQGEYLLDLAENEKERELAQTIVEKANQVSKLVSSLLLLARIDQSRQKLNKEKVDLGILVDVAIDGMKEFAAKKEILLLSHMEEGTVVEADEPLLLSVLSNLISNGIKYGNPGGYVSVSASRTGARTELIVADNGVGISPEHLDKIWGRFYRIDDVRNDECGSNGLGLAMVKSILELHGGEISVTSTPGEGTSFRILL